MKATTGYGPVPPPSPDDGAKAEQYAGWLRGVGTRSETEAPTNTREGWYALAGLSVLASVVILGISDGLDVANRGTARQALRSDIVAVA